MKNISLTFILIIFFESLIFSQDQSSKPNNLIDPKIEAKAEILEKIKNLKSNEACLLPAPIIKEELGNFAEGWHQMKKYGPNGRDYSIKMVWMSDRERAFFCGANHASPHRLNDAWEYDLAGNTWVLLYVPDYNDVGKITDYDKNTLVLQDGFLRTKKGGPGHPAHTWWGLTYSPNLKAAVWLCAWPNYRLKAKLEAIEAKEEDLYKGPAIWLFYPETKKWEPMKTEKPWPKTISFGASLEYISDLKNPVYQYGSQSLLLDTQNKSWKTINGDSKSESLPIETLIYYDIKRKTFIAHIGPNDKTKKCSTYNAKLDNDKISPWVKVLETEEAPIGHDARSTLYYDSHSGDGLLFENGPKNIWSYNPETNKWVKKEPTGDKLTPEHKGRIISYFDHSRNVYVVIGSGWVWCYRN